MNLGMGDDEIDQSLRPEVAFNRRRICSRCRFLRRPFQHPDHEKPPPALGDKMGGVEGKGVDIITEAVEGKERLLEVGAAMGGQKTGDIFHQYQRGTTAPHPF